RTEALTQQLASCGLTCKRLHNDELAQLYYGCLTPERALAHPLPAELLSAVGRPSRVKRQASKATHQAPILLAGSEHQSGAASPGWPGTLARAGLRPGLLSPIEGQQPRGTR